MEFHSTVLKQTVQITFSILTILLLSACFYADTISVSKASKAEQVEYYGISGATSTGLAFDTLNYLQTNLLMDLYYNNPELLIRKLTLDQKQSGLRELLSIKADVCYNYAMEAADADTANRYYLTAAASYYSILFDNSKKENGFQRFDPLVLRSVIRYNACAGRIFQYMKQNGLLIKKAFHLPTADSETVYFPDYPVNRLPNIKDGYESLLLCADFKTKELAHFSYQFGIGAPLIAITGYVPETGVPLKLARHLALPATCILKFNRNSDGVLSANMEFYDSTKINSLEIHGERVPITYDFSTPLAYFISNREKINLLLYMLLPARASHQGLYAMSPYDPGKIPVIFTHGLMSSPETWIQMINTLSSDPVIRENYQFWFYTYSSGNPVLLSAKQMREAVDAVAAKYGHNPKFNRMILVGHSMGGLLAKTFLLNTGDGMLNELLQRPWSEVKPNLKPEEVHMIEQMTILKTKPYVSRVVFMAVPHKGSEMANWSIARLGANLTSLPTKMVNDLTDLTLRLIPGQDMNKRYIYTGIDNLSPQNPVTKTLAKQKLAPDIPYHSIIGNNKKEEVPGGTDGIVPYESSHLDNVESELIVKSGHSVQAIPETTREIIRILHSHLKPMQK